MPELKNYRLFISHSWAYSDAYEKLVAFFNESPNFKWSDFSIPMNDPVHTNGTEKQLYDAIKNKIQLVDCVVIMAGVYSTYSKWISKEIEISKEVFSKPIVAVEPWGSVRTSAIVKESADAIAKWNSASIVSTIRQCAL